MPLTRYLHMGSVFDPQAIEAMTAAFWGRLQDSPIS
jgi:hypothetical protein